MNTAEQNQPGLELNPSDTGKEREKPWVGPGGSECVGHGTLL